MMRKQIFQFIHVLSIFGVTYLSTSISYSQELGTYEERKSVILNLCPDVEITTFSFKNLLSNRQSEEFSWKNKGSQPIVAFELVVLRYDPFNRQLHGGRGTFRGNNSGTYQALAPGASASDGFSSPHTDDAYTEVIYVRNVRRKDDTIWTVSPQQLVAELKKTLPWMTDPGNVNPNLPKID